MIKHGQSHSKLYGIWKGIKTRCLNPKWPGYQYYGGRGITICDRWLNFQNFFEDMNPTYQNGLTIDRIDGFGNYEPNNCR